MSTPAISFLPKPMPAPTPTPTPSVNNKNLGQLVKFPMPVPTPTPPLQSNNELVEGQTLFSKLKEKVNLQNSDSYILNRVSDSILSGLASIGRGYAQIERDYLGDTPDTLKNGLTYPSSQDNIFKQLNTEILPGMMIEDMIDAAVNNKIAQNFHPSSLIKVLAHAGAAVESVTGILGTLKALDEDRKNNDSSYRNTLTSALDSIGQISIGAGAGTLVGATAATMISVPAIPIILGVGAGLGASYGFKKAVDWITNSKLF